ncbi:MAG: diacylglycerol kinase family lipid kinase [Planctomycetota bacterium]|nr:diacylglycerol kinase family lipid kinase [Planctomycetota bacterium]
MPPEFLVIANPASGKRRGEHLGGDAVARLKALGRGAELYLTRSGGDARARARQAVAEGVAVVAACGGDGTQQEVAEALAGTACVMGVLPGGRCNDFARALGIRRKAPLDELVGILAGHSERKVDLARFEHPGAPARRFCTVATLGFDSAVTEFVRTHRFPIRGTAEYLHGVVRVLMNFEPPRVLLKGDFGTFDGRIMLAATGNSEFYGGAMRIAPGARIDDGLLDVCVVEAVSRTTLLRILPKVFSGGHVRHKAVRMLRTARLEIQTPVHELMLCADGEMLGSTPAILSVDPGCLRVRAQSSNDQV